MTAKTNINAEHSAAPPFSPIESNMLGYQKGPIWKLRSISYNPQRRGETFSEGDMKRCKLTKAQIWRTSMIATPTPLALVRLHSMASGKKSLSACFKSRHLPENSSRPTSEKHGCHHLVSCSANSKAHVRPDVPVAHSSFIEGHTEDHKSGDAECIRRICEPKVVLGSRSS